jgi:hypothetical protein
MTDFILKVRTSVIYFSFTTDETDKFRGRDEALESKVIFFQPFYKLHKY